MTLSRNLSKAELFYKLSVLFFCLLSTGCPERTKTEPTPDIVLPKNLVDT